MKDSLLCQWQTLAYCVNDKRSSSSGDELFVDIAAHQATERSTARMVDTDEIINMECRLVEDGDSDDSTQLVYKAIYEPILVREDSKLTY